MRHAPGSSPITSLPTRIVLGVMAATAAAAACSKPAPPPPPQPPAVQIAQVVQRDVPIVSEFVGQTRGSEEVAVQARAEGVLQSQEFAEGTRVAKGQLLFTIDPRQNQAALDQAKSRVAQARADLARVEQDVARYAPLVKENALPRQSLETAEAQAEASRANVNAALATVAAAELNMGYTRIYAPIEGIIGKAEVGVGNLVGRGQATVLTTISKIDPIHVRFSVSEREYLRLARTAAADGSASSRPQGRAADLRLVLADGSEHPHLGKLAFVDRLVDPTTGTLLVEVAFPNPERIVRPGQYGRVRVVFDTKKQAILVPQSAVQELQATYSVVVVGADNKAEFRTVQVGPRVGSLWLIEQGLTPGDKVIVEGLQKVRNGVPVTPTVVPIKDEPVAPAPSAGA